MSQLPGVGEAAAVGIADERWGERPLVLIVPAPGFEDGIDVEDVRSHVQKFVDDGVISRWAVPERVELVEAIDKTSVGKIDKKRLRARYAS